MTRPPTTHLTAYSLGQEQAAEIQALRYLNHAWRTNDALSLRSGLRHLTLSGVWAAWRDEPRYAGIHREAGVALEQWLAEQPQGAPLLLTSDEHLVVPNLLVYNGWINGRTGIPRG